jgi:hypothetical protein
MSPALPTYTIRRAAIGRHGGCPSQNWEHADIAHVDHFRPESSDHRPRTEARLLYDRENVFGQFRVQDRYVRCVHAGLNAPVYKDSCVEFFVQPNRRGYFNFEINCGGALRTYFIRDPRRVGDGFKDFSILSDDDLQRVDVQHSLPARIEPEMETPTAWSVEFRIPRALLEKYSGPVDQAWRGNFYKCGDETSHPHWASWSPVDRMNFHLPECFGTLLFEPETA